HCKNNLKQLSLSILNYESAWSYLPQAASDPTDTGHFHSWRILILPYLEKTLIYDQYRFDQPWDSPHNSSLLPQSGHAFLTCPSHQATNYPCYFAPVGPDTAWGDGERQRFRQIEDATSTTLLLIETAGRKVAWNEPRDLTMDEAIE